ncbi:hypothetical protein HAP48_0032765 [Bradyrhizobium septentrionale]|uniref:Uncharacterized protein n=1 Tax=Bradyrhizobium septentrionale TaxID=1404411 RepID=A0A974A1S8_9BRAD|nr:hypothetical protein [Bradyrhizobium septentrionale]UGY13336.1 hypothetical protein HAP48_0032765 [Bradyrhizobium septentrionale]
MCFESGAEFGLFIVADSRRAVREQRCLSLTLGGAASTTVVPAKAGTHTPQQL